MKDDIERRAHFTSGNRITLTRVWEKDKPLALVIGCNPSTADGLTDDPTVRWWNKWFRQAGFGGYVAMNLYPFCTSSPAECKKIADWENNGPDWYARDAIQSNLASVVEQSETAHQIFVCWGAIAWDLDWIEFFVEEVGQYYMPVDGLWCWGTTKNGAPKHPMARGKHRIPADQEPILWRQS